MQTGCILAWNSYFTDNIINDFARNNQENTPYCRTHKIHWLLRNRTQKLSSVTFSCDFTKQKLLLLNGINSQPLALCVSKLEVHTWEKLFGK